MIQMDLMETLAAISIYLPVFVASALTGVITLATLLFVEARKVRQRERKIALSYLSEIEHAASSYQLIEDFLYKLVGIVISDAFGSVDEFMAEAKELGSGNATPVEIALATAFVEAEKTISKLDDIPEERIDEAEALLALLPKYLEENRIKKFEISTLADFPSSLVQKYHEFFLAQEKFHSIFQVELERLSIKLRRFPKPDFVQEVLSAFRLAKSTTIEFHRLLGKEAGVSARKIETRRDELVRNKERIVLSELKRRESFNAFTATLREALSEEE